MKILHAIMTCGPDQARGCNDAVRDTYLRRWPDRLDTRFLLGRNVTPELGDEVAVNAGDAHHEHYQKCNAAVRMALEGDYDYLFTCDVDTYVYVPRLINEVRFLQPDYMGWRCDEGHAGQGHGVVFSRRACEAMANTPCQSNYFDLYTGVVLRAAGIKLIHHLEFFGQCPKSWVDAGITAHLGGVCGTGHWRPELMYEADRLVP